MSAGDFSNNGIDTFDPLNRFIGIRLKQGVPLLDRDWNELEDIRRYIERMLRRHYIGPGVPDIDGFQVIAPEFRSPNDFVIDAGRCIVDGYDVYNPKLLLFSEQENQDPLATPAVDEVLTVYLQASITRIDSTSYPALMNIQDINMETTVRDRLDWQVGVVRLPQNPPPNTFPLALINRPAGQQLITEEMITDLRRVNLNLAQVVDRTGSLEEQTAALEAQIADIQLDIEGIKQQLSRLFWDVEIEPSTTSAIFGESVPVTVIVTDGLGTPVSGARLNFTTDWGNLDPASAVTNAAGRATVDLVGIHSETPPHPSDIGILQNITERVYSSTLSNPGTIIYDQIKFEPPEMEMISKYTPPGLLADLSINLPSNPIIARPPVRTATVTVHAREGSGAIVRGVGSIQVRFGIWVREWAVSKIASVIANVEVGAQIGAALAAGDGFDVNHIVAEILPITLQNISDDTQLTYKIGVLINPEVDDASLARTGQLGQAIAQEATAAVGHNTNQAISNQIQALIEDPGTELNTEQGWEAHTKIIQKSSQISAGFAQNQKQMFAARGR